MTEVMYGGKGSTHIRNNDDMTEINVSDITSNMILLTNKLFSELPAPEKTESILAGLTM